MPDGEAESNEARDEFVVLYFGDRDRGVIRTEAEYLRLFPGREAAVSDEWRRLEALYAEGATSADATDGARGTDPSLETLAGDSAPGHALRNVDRYRILNEIGRGGQGTVYLATDPQVGRPVAVKVLKAPWTGSVVLSSRFQREARALARLDHPGLASVHDTGEVCGLAYFVMTYVEGHTLASEMAKHGAAPASGSDRGPLDRYVGLIEATARTLHVAHEAGLVHRDVKPGNIMVTPSGDPVILDFGLARLLDEDPCRLTETGDILGTPGFMAPEQASGNPRAIDRRTDVFGLGSTLRALLRSAGWPDLRAAPDLDAVLQVATEPDPDRRYATAQDFADDLHRVRRRLPVSVRPAGRLRKSLTWCRRNPSAAALVVLPPLVLIASLVGLAFANARIEVAARELRHQEELADASTTEAKARFDQFQRLDDLVRVDALIEREPELWPAHPKTVAAIEAWLADADVLMSRLPAHQRALEALRARGRRVAADGTAADPADGRIARIRRVRAAAAAEVSAEAMPESRRANLKDVIAKADAAIRSSDATDALRPAWHFDHVEDRWLHDNLSRLVAALETLGATDGVGCTRAAVAKRLAFARSLERESLLDRAEPWNRAVEAIADVRLHPAYGGLRIRPILGLVPLGADRTSGLWEFAHLASGNPPERTATGSLALRDDSGVVLVLIPGGTYRMGARPPADEDEPAGGHVDPAAQPKESPIHEVRLDPFFISKHELTQGQWLRVTGVNPSHARPDRAWDHGYAPTLRNPVEQVSYLDCEEVLRRLDLSMPTEAQWEAAARGGTTTPWWCGRTLSSLPSTENMADSRWVVVEGSSGPADMERDDGWSGPAPVGSYGGNPFGLHDVIGNVSEWCRDRMEFYRIPVLPGDGLRSAGIVDARAVRGGAFNMVARNGRSSARFGMNERTRVGWIGVRPAMGIGGP